MSDGPERNAVLEEAALACEALDGRYFIPCDNDGNAVPRWLEQYDRAKRDCAEAIRQLKRDD